MGQFCWEISSMLYLLWSQNPIKMCAQEKQIHVWLYKNTLCYQRQTYNAFLIPPTPSPPSFQRLISHPILPVLPPNMSRVLPTFHPYYSCCSSGLYLDYCIRVPSHFSSCPSWVFSASSPIMAPVSAQYTAAILNHLTLQNTYLFHASVSLHILFSLPGTQ